MLELFSKYLKYYVFDGLEKFKWQNLVEIFASQIQTNKKIQ